MKYSIQLLSVNKKREKDADLLFGCDLTTLQSVQTFVGAMRVKLAVVGAEDDKIIGQVVSASVSAIGDDSNCKFKIKTDGSQNVNTAQLSSMCGEAFDITIDLDD